MLLTRRGILCLFDFSDVAILPSSFLAWSVQKTVKESEVAGNLFHELGLDEDLNLGALGTAGEQFKDNCKVNNEIFYLIARSENVELIPIATVRHILGRVVRNPKRSFFFASILTRVEEDELLLPFADQCVFRFRAAMTKQVYEVARRLLRVTGPSSGTTKLLQRPGVSALGAFRLIPGDEPRAPPKPSAEDLSTLETILFYPYRDYITQRITMSRATDARGNDTDTVNLVIREKLYMVTGLCVARVGSNDGVRGYSAEEITDSPEELCLPLSVIISRITGDGDGYGYRDISVFEKVTMSFF